VHKYNLLYITYYVIHVLQSVLSLRAYLLFLSMLHWQPMVWLVWLEVRWSDTLPC